VGTYSNPVGTLAGTSGDDLIVVDAAPGSVARFNALGGVDTLRIQLVTASSLSFDVGDEYNASYFNVDFRADPFTSMAVFNVENVDLHGSLGSDSFWLRLGPTTSGLSVLMDGGAGQDQLRLDWSRLGTGQSFIVGGTSVASTLGSFSNLEVFTIRAGSGNDSITTGIGDDYVLTGGGFDRVSTGGGNDSIEVNSAGGSIDAGGGADHVTFTAISGLASFNGTMDGGSGEDTLHLDWSALSSGQTFVLEGATVSSSLAGFIGFDLFQLLGGGGDDLITTGAGDDYIYAGAGNDRLSVGNGSNQIAAGAGNDTISAGVGNDQLTGGVGNDIIVAGEGTDVIYGDDGQYSFTGDGNDQLDGGGGNDTIYGGGGDDIITGGSGNDSLLGGAGSDRVDGGDGNDNIVGDGDAGGAGNISPDILIGGSGDDTITGGWADIIDGGAGTDQLYFNAYGASQGINANFLQLTNGGTIVVGGATLTGIEYVNNIVGTGYGDNIIAGATNNGSDLYIDAYGGDDIVTGTVGVDWINGGDGNDVLSGGRGSDRLTGGNGNDTFRGTAAELNTDIITSLDVGDKIVITDADPRTFNLSYDGRSLSYAGGKLDIATVIAGKLVVSAAPGGGTQISVEALPVATLDQIAVQLTTGFWDGDTHRFNVAAGGTITVDVSSLTSTEQGLARAALQAWSDVIAVTFREVSGGAMIVFDHTEDPSGPIAGTDASWANGIISSAHIQISSSWVNAYGTSLNSYSYQTYVHEIGHALGLGHPGNYNVEATYQIGSLFANDGWPLTIMSYFDQEDSRYFRDNGFDFAYVLTPMVADIVAAQALYGASTSSHAGNSVYGYHSNVGGVYDANAFRSAEITIVDGSGIDTLDYSGFGGFQSINLNPESFSSVNGYRNTLAIGRGTFIENAIGGSGIDVIIGNAVGNSLTGNLGDDTLTGGAGNDVFVDTRAGHAGDRVTDFQFGDSIVFSDVSIDNFTYSVLGNALSFSGGTLNLGNVPVGRIVASAVVGGGVQLTLAPAAVHDDFNGDHRSDVLWRHQDGTITNWLGGAGGGFVANDGNALAAVPVSWSVVGTADFNGDGKADLLWTNEEGTVTDWLGTTSGGFTANGNVFWEQVPSSWKVEGTGDFNGDGRGDILWRNADDTLTDWLGNANGTFSQNGGTLWASVPQVWHVEGTGDFNGDGRSDILWRNNDGTVTNWLGSATGAFAPNATNVYAVIPSEWRIAGTGDFNGDGRADILWRHQDGTVTDWLGTSTGGYVANGAALVPMGTQWQVAGVGDYNGDGRGDLIWRDNEGNFTRWDSLSSGAFSHDNLINLVDRGWHVLSPGLPLG